MPAFRKNVVYALATLFEGSLNLLSDNELENLAGIIAQSRRSSGRDKLSTFAKSFDQVFNHFPNRIEFNGEKWLLAATSSLNFQTIFDVGANIGNWSAVARKYHSAAYIHCFEAVEETRKILKKRIEELPGEFSICDFGLSDRDGNTKIYKSEGTNLISSVYNFRNVTGHRASTETAQVRTGDSYIEETNIENIDLLKIDVEGAKSLVLKGFQSALENSIIKIIQFEYNRSEIFSKFLLKDFYEMLEYYSYNVGRLFPDGVIFKPYNS